MTLRELQTCYSLEDLYDILEIGVVRAENHRLVMKRQEAEAEAAAKGLG